MPDLAVILLTDNSTMVGNLLCELDEQGPKPWAFNGYTGQMAGIRPGTHIAFLRVTNPDGRAVGKSSTYPIDAVIHRLVLGPVVTAIEETRTPFFPGFPYEFRYDLDIDRTFDEPPDLSEFAEFLNGEWVCRAVR